MIIFAGSKGYLDKVPRPKVAEWERQFVQFMREQRPEVRKKLVQERKLTKDIEKELIAAIEFFQPQFQG